MTGPDPVDVRLLSAVADSGRASVHEIAARLGMDSREVAARLAVLSATGLPLFVGVECDQAGVRNAIAAANVWAQRSGGHQVPQNQAPGQRSGGHQVPQSPPGPDSGGHQVPQNQPFGPHSGGHQVPGPYPVAKPGGPQPFVPPGPPQFPPPHPAAADQSGSHQSGPQQVPGQPADQQPNPHRSGPNIPASPQPPDSGPQPMSTWGPPGSAAWARAEAPAARTPPPAAPGSPAPADAPTAQTLEPVRPAAARTGQVGSRLEVPGPEGERISIVLVEVVDPADFLFTAAGHHLPAGERSVVVHTELTNLGPMPFTSLPDLYLELVAEDGGTIGKTTVALSSRPPHRMGVPPGETVGGHTVYVLAEDTELSAVRWSPLPGAADRALVWDITDL